MSISLIERCVKRLFNIGHGKRPDRKQTAPEQGWSALFFCCRVWVCVSKQYGMPPLVFSEHRKKISIFSEMYRSFCQFHSLFSLFARQKKVEQFLLTVMSCFRSWKKGVRSATVNIAFTADKYLLAPFFGVTKQQVNQLYWIFCSLYLSVNKEKVTFNSFFAFRHFFLHILFIYCASVMETRGKEKYIENLLGH